MRQSSLRTHTHPASHDRMYVLCRVARSSFRVDSVWLRTYNENLPSPMIDVGRDKDTKELLLSGGHAMTGLSQEHVELY